MFTRRGTVRRRDSTAGRRVNVYFFQIKKCTWVYLLITQYCTVLYSTLQYCTVLYSTVQYWWYGNKSQHNPRKFDLIIVSTKQQRFTESGHPHFASPMVFTLLFCFQNWKDLCMKLFKVERQTNQNYKNTRRQTHTIWLAILTHFAAVYVVWVTSPPKQKNGL